MQYGAWGYFIKNSIFWTMASLMIVRFYDCPILLYAISLHETLCSSDLMIVRPYDRPTLWSSDLRIVWTYDCLILSRYMKPYDRLTLWSSDLMFVWTYDLTLCLSGETGELMIWPYVCPVKPYDRPCWWSSCWWLSANPPRGLFCGFGSPLGLLFCLKVPFFSILG